MSFNSQVHNGRGGHDGDEGDGQGEQAVGGDEQRPAVQPLPGLVVVARAVARDYRWEGRHYFDLQIDK